MKTKDHMVLESIYMEMIEPKKDGLSQGMTLEDIANKHGVDILELEKELYKGMEVEKEHTSSEDEAMKIAMDHLVEDPKYYTKIKKIGL